MIADDEAPAREKLRLLLAEHADVEIVAECDSGIDALERIVELDPDLVFLDIHMPGMTGLAVLQSLPECDRPSVIFVTAYDEHAIAAFDVEAIDYLLKPFTRERFVRALERYRAREHDDGSVAYGARVSRALERAAPAFPYDRIPLRMENGTALLPIDDLDWAESEANYIRIHAGKLEARLRETMDIFYRRLPEGRFIRIHRSIVVAVSRIVRIEPWANSEYILVLGNGTKLKSSRAYASAIRALTA